MHPEIFPKFRKPTELAVVNSKGLDCETRLSLSALQGLVNASEPRIYQVSGPWDEHWLRYYRDKFGVGFRRLRNPMQLFKLYRDVPKGTVIYDLSVPDTKNLATTIAGLEGLIPASSKYAAELERHGLAPKEDLRGRFKDRLSAYAWAKDTLLPRCNRRILGSLCVGSRGQWLENRTELVDYMVANRSFVFHLSAARRDREENRLFDEVLEAAGGPGVLMGWHCVRDQEKEYVARAARKGFFVLCSPQSPNLTVHGGIPRARRRYAQVKPKAPAKLEKKVYLALYMTDGDAIWAMSNLQSENWLSKKRGSFPFSWGLLPLMYDIMPGMLKYYYETATRNDYFMCPSSGAAYTYSFLHDDWYLHYSKHYMELSGQKAVNMVNWDTNFWWREVEEPRAIYREKRILKPVGLVCGLGGSVYARSYPAGTPKVHSAIVLNAGEDCAARIREMARAMKERPLFIFAFVQISHGVYDHLVENLKTLPDEIELVHMDAFMLGLRKALKEGLVSEDLYPSKAQLADATLREPGRRDKAAAARLLEKLASVARMPEDQMAREINLGNWHNLASREPAHVEPEAESWRRTSGGYLDYDTPNLADALGYNLFYTAWAYVRACLNAAGRYANHMDSCLDEYLWLFPSKENGVLEEIWEMWRNWDAQPPRLNAVRDMAIRAARLAVHGASGSTA